MTTAVATTDQSPAYALEMVDPHQVIVGANVRTTTAEQVGKDKRFVASIKERGVLTPVVGYRDQDGQIVVLMGQRRTYAAILAGRATMPAMLAPSSQDADRIVDQLVENTHRAATSATDEVAAVQTLMSLGLSAATIAKRTATKRAQVDAAATVAGSANATAAIAARADLSLLQIAVLAEFEDDQDATARLLASSPGQFDHTAQRLRDQAAEQLVRAQFVAGLKEQGLSVVEAPAYDGQTTARRLSALTDENGQELDEVEHLTCPGHAVYLAREWIEVFTETGEDVPDDYEEQVDEEGHAIGPAIEHRDAFGAHPCCTDAAGNGHRDRYQSARNASGQGEPSEEERAAKKRERREVIAGNKQWTSAETVRREWLRSMLSRKTAPKGAHAFLATILIGHGYVVTQQNGGDHTAALLGVETPTFGHNTVAPALDGASENRAAVIALACVIGGCEALMNRDQWRSPSGWVSPYLDTLAGWGYPLSPVEQRAAGQQVDLLATDA